MIVVKVELWNANTGEHSEIGRTYIANVGGTRERGDYKVAVARKGSGPYNGWDKIKATRRGSVRDYPRLSYNVWRLVCRALRSAFPEES